MCDYVGWLDGCETNRTWKGASEKASKQQQSTDDKKCTVPACRRLSAVATSVLAWLSRHGSHHSLDSACPQLCACQTLPMATVPQSASRQNRLRSGCFCKQPSNSCLNTQTPHRTRRSWHIESVQGRWRRAPILNPFDNDGPPFNDKDLYYCYKWSFYRATISGAIKKLANEVNGYRINAFD